LLTSLVLVFAAPAWADTYKLYRCTLDGGQLEMRAYPCPEGQGAELTIRDQPIGWEAPPPTPIPKARGDKKLAKEPKPAADQDKRQQEEKCWKAEQHLEQVSAKLRRDYKASQGDRLHQQQAQYEDYLRRFCP
jgi:hypothetical protein